LLQTTRRHTFVNLLGRIGGALIIVPLFITINYRACPTNSLV